MPRRRNAATKAVLPTATRRSTRQSAARVEEEKDVPDVFQDMLVEAFHNNPEDFAPSPRAGKRRKVKNDVDEEAQRIQPVVEKELFIPPSPKASEPAASRQTTPERAQQVVFRNDYSDEDDSDVSFEDVQISRHASPLSDEEPRRPEAKTLQLDLSTSSKAVQSNQPARAKTKPLTKVERLHRLNVHKWHLLCLISHIQTVNQWCDDEVVQKTLKPLIRNKLINQLHVSESQTQGQRKFSFDNAIAEICLQWKIAFNVTAPGIRRAVWRDHLNIEAEMDSAPDPVDFDDFKSAAKTKSGSRDLGAQLFCALLRSLAVETRLVCSLQALPFARASTTVTPQKGSLTYITADAQNYGSGTPEPRPAKKKKIVDSPYPIWWVEVFSPAIMQWIPLDPVVRNTINKPRTGFEPAVSDPLNGMSYVLAFEEDGTAKDVTQRYTSYYNAKTRRTRVEITKGGGEWFASVMNHFAKSDIERHDKDDIEDAALSLRVAQEGMPKNVQDFKDHPVYVIERDLRRNEVIEPKRECGKFSVGAGKNVRLESVYRREDVHYCRSSEAWYRRGRDIKPGQQALKHIASRKKRVASIRLDDEAEEEAVEEEDDDTPLYAEFQTDLYVPPPVVDGRVPRNGFGNLDVYVPSMIPGGSVHVRHWLAKQAAKVLRIDAAEAVTGFVFKARQGTAVLDGVVVDAKYTAAMLDTIKALEDQLEDEVIAQRSAILLSVWKKMEAVLRVRQRIQEEYGQKADIDVDNKNDEVSEDEEDDPTYEHSADGGGFMLDVHGEATKISRAEEAENLKMLRDRAPVVLPPLVVKQRPVVIRSPHELPINTVSPIRNGDDDLFGDNEDESGGFERENGYDTSDNAGGFTVEDDSSRHHSRQKCTSAPEDIERRDYSNNDNTGGGSIPEHEMDTDAAAGGFFPENDTPVDQPPNMPPTTSTSTERLAATSTPTYATTSPKPSLSPKSLPTRLTPPEVASSLHPTIIPLDEIQSSTNSPTVEPTADSDPKPETHEAKHVDADSLSDASFPSHDPDEDDAEMQWVEDAFEV